MNNKDRQKMAEAEKTEEKSKNQNMLEVLLGMDLSPKARAMTYERSIDKSKTKTFMEENRDNEEVYTTAPEVANAQAKENETVTIAKIREIQRADISDDAKAALYYGMVASDETRELMDKMTDEGASGAEVAKTLMQIQDADILKGAERSISMRNAIANSNLEEEHKLELYRKKISDDKEDEIAQFRAAGMDLDTFIEVQNEYSRIKDTGKKASQQAQDLSHWLEKQNLTDRQKKTARECFTFYSMVPADAKYFNQAVEAGVDADKAYIEGYRFVPSGYTWIRDDGTVFTGEMIAPLKDWKELDDAQREYERKQLADMAAELADAKEALAVLGVMENA